jgi:DNA-binding phage protein
MADAPKSVAQAATQVDPELSRQLIDKILSGGTESTLALLLAVALIALGACLQCRRESHGIHR